MVTLRLTKGELQILNLAMAELMEREKAVGLPDNDGNLNSQIKKKLEKAIFKSNAPSDSLTAKVCDSEEGSVSEQSREDGVKKCPKCRSITIQKSPYDDCTKGQYYCYQCTEYFDIEDAGVTEKKCPYCGWKLQKKNYCVNCNIVIDFDKVNWSQIRGREQA